jgi:hypothetical protein
VRAWAFLLFAGCAYQSPTPPGSNPDPDPDAAVAADAPVDTAVDAPPAVPVTTDHPSVADTFLSAINTNDNFSQQTSALADLDGRVALFRFDLAAIPTTSKVSKVELHIWSDTDPGQACNFFQVLQSWDEATVTWNSRSAGTAWTSPGAEPPSRGTTILATVLPNTQNTEYVLAIDSDLVAAWVAEPATNFGFAIVSTSSDGARFSTREHPTAGQRPFLRVTHAP